MGKFSILKKMNYFAKQFDFQLKVYTFRTLSLYTLTHVERVGCLEGYLVSLKSVQVIIEIKKIKAKIVQDTSIWNITVVCANRLSKHLSDPNSAALASTTLQQYISVYTCSVAIKFSKEKVKRSLQLCRCFRILVPTQLSKRKVLCYFVSTAVLGHSNLSTPKGVRTVTSPPARLC